MAPNSTDMPAADESVADYRGRLRRAALAPLWESMSALAPFEPAPRARPFRWAYADVRGPLMEAGRRITAAEAERRVLVLANPGLGDRLQITDTLYAGLQLILPGEVAPPHRHSQSALRFVFEGEGAYTAVDGTRAVMRPGDFIVTPAWTWHEHGGGDGPVVWMDGLDVPLVGFLRAGFREEGTEAPATDAAAEPPVFHHPYAPAREALERLRRSAPIDPHHGFVHRYALPGGAPVMPTIGAALRLLPEGFETLPYRSTDGAVATVVEGRVRADVGGEAFELGPRDVLALPGWTPYRLQALEESVVFGFSDRPVHEALGLWREQRGDAAA